MAQRKGSMSESNPEVEPKEEVQEVEQEPVDDTVSNQVDDEEYDSYKMDPEEEVWPGGPKFAQINEWKDRFGDIYVTSVTPTEHVVWRTMTRFEYRRLIQNTEQALSTGQMSQAMANLDNEDSISELCILYPPYSRTDSTSSLGGMASTIAQQVMEASGFSSLEVRQL